MNPAIATLQSTAKAMAQSGKLDAVAYNCIVAHLNRAANEMAAAERRKAQQRPEAVELIEVLRNAIATMASPNNFKAVLPDAVFVEGPANDLRDLMCSLLAFAGTTKASSLKLEIRDNPDQDARNTCVADFVIAAQDVPDFLRQKIWSAARVRQGEASVVTGHDGCQVKITLPVERRLGAAQSKAA